MKGIVFREFTNMVEDVFSSDMVDDLIDATNPASGGAYTSVSTYDYHELLDMVVELSKRTDTPVADLVHAFGKHLAKVFAEKFSDFFSDCDNTLDFLKSIDNHIHVEVKKLYPDAELPKFSYEDSDPDNFVLHYQSSRPFAALAHGLIEGCAEYYQENFDIQTQDESDANNSRVKFTLQRAA